MDFVSIPALEPAATDALTPEDLGLTASQPGGDLGKDEFLQLLTTQLQYQDPLNPMDNTAMIAQLAQFSALEQMENLNTQVQAGRQESGLVLAAALTGQTVDLTLANGTAVSGVVDGVQWGKDGVCLNIGEATYAMKDIAKLKLATPEAEAPAAEAPAQETPAADAPATDTAAG
jgi:flagellar basal-body rod modification protein FlgD